MTTTEPLLAAIPLGESTPPLAAKYDVIIIGGGIAGLSAALYAARAGHATLVLEGLLMSSTDYPGGQLMLTPSIENYPGFAGGSGADLIATVRSQAESFGAVLHEDRATEIAPAAVPGAYHEVKTSNGDSVYGRKVIIATGSIARRLGVPGEDDLYGHGVSSCATCDGPFFAGKTVAVVGGGEVAVEDALYMTEHAEHVYLIHRRNRLRSTAPAARTLEQHPKVTILWNTVVKEVIGKMPEAETALLFSQPSVDHLLIETPDGEKTLPVSALFVAVGHDPQTEVCFKHDSTQAVIELDGYGYIKARGTRTNIPGVFVAGDVADPVYRQAITAAATGAQAGMEASRELSEESQT